MSFATNLYHLMTSDTSLNSYCTGGIHYENLPENWEIIKDWIVYSFNKVEQVNCINSSPTYTRYAIQAKIVANDTKTLEKISDHLADYLNDISYGGIHDIIFLNDTHTLDLDKNIYMNTLNFEGLYV